MTGSLRRLVREMHERRIADVMLPFLDDPVGFATALQIQLPRASEEALRLIHASADGGTIGLASDEVNERAVLLGLFWWLLRRPDSLVVVGCNSTPQAVACLALVHAFAHRVQARIAEHVTFESAHRMRVARRAGWGMVFEVCPNAHKGHDAPHLAGFEIAAGSLGLGLQLPVRPDVLRVSTWEVPKYGEKG